MLARTTILALGTLGMLTALIISIRAGGGPGAESKPGQRAIKRPLAASECEQLVKQLVYPDKPPVLRTHGLRPPEGVTEETLRKKQAKVMEAYDALWENFEVALPLLVKHANDERFSFLYTTVSGAAVEVDVGGACSRIIKAHVEVYRLHATSHEPINGAPRYPSFIYDECDGVEKWWKGRQGKPLVELQLEGIEWVLRQPKPRFFKSEKRWATAKEDLNKMARGIRASKKPIPMGEGREWSEAGWAADSFEGHHPVLIFYK